MSSAQEPREHAAAPLRAFAADRPESEDGAQADRRDPLQADAFDALRADGCDALRADRCDALEEREPMSLRRGLAILSLFSSERQWWRIGEIARAIGGNPFDTHMQVTAMRRLNFIQEGSHRRYGLGSGPPDPTTAVRAMGLVRRTRAHLIALQRLCHCPVTLAMLDGTELVVVDRAVASSSPRLHMTIDLYRRLPAHATALGKVLLAYQPEHREQTLVEGMRLEAMTPFTITDKRMLLRELQRVRSCSLAVEDREHLPQRRCIAAPVRGAHQLVIAAVGVAITDSDTPLQQLAKRYSVPLRSTAAQLSHALRDADMDGSDVDWPRL